MNVHVLIDAIVRQTTVLVAQLATTGGSRAALGHTVNQVFLEPTTELKRQGLNNKLIADLFGVSLRTYHNKVRRLNESTTDRGRPLWNAVLDYVQTQGAVLRADVLLRFCKDDPATVRSVLNDLVEVGLVFAKGRGDAQAYRAASAQELELGSQDEVENTRQSLVWILVARHSPLRREDLLELSQLETLQVDAALAQLCLEGKVRVRDSAGQREYLSDECVIPLGQALGWEASVFDHYQAVVTSICAKLALGSSRAERGEHIGGSTYSVEVWPEHPLYNEALSLLQSLRDRAASLRARVDDVNRTLLRPEHGIRRVIAYVGQNVTDLTGEPEE